MRSFGDFDAEVDGLTEFVSTGGRIASPERRKARVDRTGRARNMTMCKKEAQ